MRESRVRFPRFRRRLLDTDAMSKRDRIDEVLDSSPASAPAERDHQRGAVTGSDDDVRRPAGTVNEVPRPQGNLLILDEEKALAGEDEEALLVPLPVIEAHRLAGQEPVEIDPDLAER